MESESQYHLYKMLVESTNATPWKLDWSTKIFSYIGPQIERLLGWPISSWKTVDDWINRIHPADREWVKNFCIAQSLSGLDHEAKYRALTSKGDYIWVRDIVHVVRENEKVKCLIGYMIKIPASSTRSCNTFSESQPDLSKGVAMLLRETFQFTEAESKLAEALLSGCRPADYARDRGVSINTVRSQIRALLEKTGVTRQTDLLRVLSNSAIDIELFRSVVA